MPQLNPQVSTAQALQDLVYFNSLERCVLERIPEARRHVIEHLADYQPTVTMGSNEHSDYVIAPFNTLLNPSLDPAFRGLPPEGTGPTLEGPLPPGRQSQFAIGLGLDLIVGNAPMTADNRPVAQPVQDFNFGDADGGLVTQPIQGLDLTAGDAPTIANDGPVAQPVQNFFGAGFPQAPSNSPAKASVKCPKCPATFKRDNLRRHLNEVHGAKPRTSCDRCGKSFTRKSSMKGHKCRSF
ncbi:hypothetical protein F4604DRAFT_183313 [Suillus subluteus]|nr:hypothetical protein F4604DRAFT_183313 [Suillus subluteus]